MIMTPLTRSKIECILKELVPNIPLDEVDTFIANLNTVFQEEEEAETQKEIEEALQSIKNSNQVMVQPWLPSFSYRIDPVSEKHIKLWVNATAKDWYDESSCRLQVSLNQTQNVFAKHPVRNVELKRRFYESAEKFASRVSIEKADIEYEIKQCKRFHQSNSSQLVTPA